RRKELSRASLRRPFPTSIGLSGGTQPSQGNGFFFQAEDGIRDGHVTGVQTCALPISAPRRRWVSSGRCSDRSPGSRSGCRRGRGSEERRVGKECISRRWSNEKKKKFRVTKKPVVMSRVRSNRNNE